MLKQILSDIKLFFAMNHVTLTAVPEEYARLIRIINRSYSQISSEYPLPELDHTICIQEINTQSHFSDFIPFKTTDKRDLNGVPILLLSDYSIADLFGLESTIPTSTLICNDMHADLIMRQSFSTETSPTYTSLATQQIAPFSSYQISFNTLSTWFLSLYINDKKFTSFSEVTEPTISLTHSLYGTFTIDYIQQRVTIRSGRIPYFLKIESTSFSSSQFRAVICKMGIRFLYSQTASSLMPNKIIFTQRSKPPLLLLERDNSVNNEYDQAITIYSIENIATMNKNLVNSQMYAAIAQKRQEQVDRLTKTILNYRTRRTYSRIPIRII
ncbi:MAG: hypothetical protein ACRCX2_12050 [Paraclostridium sp.]